MLDSEIPASPGCQCLGMAKKTCQHQKLKLKYLVFSGQPMTFPPGFQAHWQAFLPQRPAACQ